MKRALELAKLGAGKVHPNPMVGCVIVHEGKIIGEGYHQKYGQAHAEVKAIASVKDKLKLSSATLYVSLEPCSHFGKTPPCADLLIHYQIPKVHICNLDPFEMVAGKGIQKLREAGIEVEIGILAKEGRWLNRRFFTYIEKKRPYIILKWAETADGFVAGENFQTVQISNQLSRKLVHKFRSEEAAIMVGTNTARYDNPMLNVREWTGENPVRIVLDKNLSLPKHLNLFKNIDENKLSKTLIFNELEDKVENNNDFVKIDFHKDFLHEILNELYKRKILSVLVEGGTRLLQTFLDAQLFDEIYVFKSSKNLGSGIPAPRFSGVKLMEKHNLLGDEWLLFGNNE